MGGNHGPWWAFSKRRGLFNKTFPNLSFEVFKFMRWFKTLALDNLEGEEPRGLFQNRNDLTRSYSGASLKKQVY